MLRIALATLFYVLTIHHRSHDAKEEVLGGPPLVGVIRRWSNNESSLLGDLTLVRNSQGEDLLCRAIKMALINPSDLVLVIQIGKQMRGEFNPNMFVVVEASCREQGDERPSIGGGIDMV